MWSGHEHVVCFVCVEIEIVDGAYCNYLNKQETGRSKSIYVTFLSMLARTIALWNPKLLKSRIKITKYLLLIYLLLKIFILTYQYLMMMMTQYVLNIKMDR